MQRPTENLRRAIADQLEEIAALTAAGSLDAGDEDRLDRVLVRILKAVEAAMDEPVSNQTADEALAAIEAWAALASYAVASVYAPANLLRRGLAGWSVHVSQHLREIGDALRCPLDEVARNLKAGSMSVSVGFPWGVSVSLDWAITS